LQVVTEKCLAANFALCIQRFAFKFLIISLGYSWHMKWPTTATVVHINIIIKSYLRSLLNSFFSPLSNARPACVSKHRGRQRGVSILSDQKGRAPECMVTKIFLWLPHYQNFSRALAQRLFLTRESCSVKSLCSSQCRRSNLIPSCE